MALLSMLIEEPKGYKYCACGTQGHYFHVCKYHTNTMQIPQIPYKYHTNTTNTIQIPHKYHQIPYKYHKYHTNTRNTIQIPHKYHTITTNTIQILHKYHQIPYKYHTNTTQIPYNYHKYPDMKIVGGTAGKSVEPIT